MLVGIPQFLPGHHAWQCQQWAKCFVGAGRANPCVLVDEGLYVRDVLWLHVDSCFLVDGDLYVRDVVWFRVQVARHNGRLRSERFVLFVDRRNEG